MVQELQAELAGLHGESNCLKRSNKELEKEMRAMMETRMDVQGIKRALQEAQHSLVRVTEQLQAEKQTNKDNTVMIHGLEQVISVTLGPEQAKCTPHPNPNPSLNVKT